MKRALLLFILFLPFCARAQIITTYAGNGAVGYSGDNGQATNASLASPAGINLDDTGNLLICQEDLVRKVNRLTGVISTVAGDTAAQTTGDGGPAISASVVLPYSVCVDALGNLYIYDYWAIEVREVNISTGIISDYAGTTFTAGATGDEGEADTAKVDAFCVCIDTSRRILYISDEWNHKIRKVDMTTGIITTFAGTGMDGYSGDNGPAISAELSRTLGISLDRTGNLYICDWDNERIRKVDIASGIITTVAGNGTAGYSGDSGLAENAMMDRPQALCFDTCGNLLFADASNERVREINATTGIITTIAGNGTAGFAGDNGPATDAELNGPEGICIDKYGSVYVSDYHNQRVRKITMAASTCSDTTIHNQSVGSISKSSISIYPNPAYNTITITANTPIKSVALINLLGQTVYTQMYNSEKVQVNIENLPKGIYFVKVNEMWVQKVVKE